MSSAEEGNRMKGVSFWDDFIFEEGHKRGHK